MVKIEQILTEKPGKWLKYKVFQAETFFDYETIIGCYKHILKVLSIKFSFKV